MKIAAPKLTQLSFFAALFAFATRSAAFDHRCVLENAVGEITLVFLVRADITFHAAFAWPF